MVFAMSKSNLVAFRIPSELQDEFNRSVLASGGDKTSWLVDAIRMKLGQPEKSIDSRMLGLVERMEKAAASLIAGKPNIPPKPYNETAVIKIIADTIRQGFDNGRVIAERLNEAGYQTKAGKAWDKDIYSAWKRQGSNAEKLSVALRMNRPGFPGECFICELRLPDHRFRWKHNKLFLLLPEEYGPAFPAIVDCYTSPPTLVWPVPLLSGFSNSYGVLPPLCKDH